MPRKDKKRVGKYVVKFGMVHKGPRLDYRAIFEPLGVRSLELAVYDNGVVYVMLTTERCRTAENVKHAVEKYNASDIAERDGSLDLLTFSDDSEDIVLTFNRAGLHRVHPFYGRIKFVRDKSLVTGDASNYWMWGSNQKIKTAEVPAASSSHKKKSVARRDKKDDAESETQVGDGIYDEWTEFRNLVAKCNFGFSGIDVRN